MERNNCLVCGDELIYFNKSRKMKCYYCHKEFDSNCACEKGHFVCDSCHSLDALGIIKKYCMASAKKNPVEMAIELMRHPSFNMHGPEHHFLVVAVLLTAYKNATGHIDEEEFISLLKEGEKRAKNVPGGACGFFGACGAGVGTGIFMSLITHATPLSEMSWKNANLITSKALNIIAMYGGPRCCKRDTFLALETAVEFLWKEYNIELEQSIRNKCEFSYMNNECIKSKCKFYIANINDKMRITDETLKEHRAFEEKDDYVVDSIKNVNKGDD